MRGAGGAIVIAAALLAGWRVPWVRLALVLGVVAAVFGAGVRAGGWLSDRAHAGELASAQRDTEQARRSAAELQAAVDRAASEQAQKTAAAVIKQSNTTQEVSRESSDRRERLDLRIAAGGLRIAAQPHSSGCSLPTIATGPGRTDEAAAQPVPADRAGNPGAPAPGLAAEMPPAQQVIDDAARDAQQLAELAEWVCRQGMCE